MDDYDVLPFSQTRGELYSGSKRAATWHEETRGRYLVALYERERGQEREIRKGEINQTDKARCWCEIWVRDGDIPQSMKGKA